MVLVTTAILLNEIAEEKVAWITGSFFTFFCFLGYLTGKYAPLIGFLKGWVLLWNPFLKEPHFLDKLKEVSSGPRLRCVLTWLVGYVVFYLQSIIAYHMSNSPSKSLVAGNNEDDIDIKNTIAPAFEPPIAGSSGKVKKRQTKRKNSLSGNIVMDSAVVGSPPRENHRALSSSNSSGKQSDHPDFSTPIINGTSSSSKKRAGRYSSFPMTGGLSEEQVLSKSVCLRFARRHPELYLKLLGHLLVMSELVALLTPAVAMGIQWVTALCRKNIIICCPIRLCCYCCLI